MGTIPTPGESAEPAATLATRKTPEDAPPAASAATANTPEHGVPAQPTSSVKVEEIGSGAIADSRKTSWVIMLYIAADAILANFGVESLKELNESASSATDPNDAASVIVAAQFSIDAPGGQHIPRYVFDRCSGGNLGRSLKGYLHAPPNMSEQEALTSFLDWVYKRDDCQADNYALVLWSHGPELFLQPPPGDPTGASSSLYLTPLKLRQAIKNGVPPTQAESLKIVGFDACSMSMFEMAFEIRDIAEYMVASQEEVPDLSFPYNSLVQLFRKYGANMQSLLEQGVRSYVQTYQDYICGALTTMKPVTLSALRLKESEALFRAIEKLASSLLASQEDPDLPAYLINARGKSRDYAAGLYVDLVEFCSHLYEQLYPSTTFLGNVQSGDADFSTTGSKVSEHDPHTSTNSSHCNELTLTSDIDRKRQIRDACREVLDAIRVDADGVSTGFVLVNCSVDTRSHGVSLYLPYLNDQEISALEQPVVAGTEQPMVKGTRDVPLKGIPVALNASASAYLMSSRDNLIIATESYYGDLAFSTETAWYEFITKFWTRILISLDSESLDLRYSAVQSAINAIRK
jgi:hypothetical protein